MGGGAHDGYPGQQSLHHPQLASRPTWALIAATNLVLSAGRWRRRGPTQQASALEAPSLGTAPYAAAAPSAQWFVDPGSASAARPGALRVVGER